MPTLIAFQWNLIASNFQIKCTARGSHLPFLEETSTSWSSSCPGVPSPVTNPTSPLWARWCRTLCWAGRALPELPQCPLAARELHLLLLYLSSLRSPVGFHASEHQLSSWISKAVFASSFRVSVCGEGAVPAAQGHLLSLYPSKSGEQITAVIWQSERQIHFAR